MGSDGRVGKDGEGIAFGAESIEIVMRQRIRERVERLVAEQLEAALGASKSQRAGEKRTGYRHGTREPTLTTSQGQ